MKKRFFSFVTGMIVGAALFGGSYAYASGILAELSSNQIFVDGTLASMEAYVINGHNYVKLRDIGQYVGFNVFWDSEEHCVRVESDTPYTGLAPETLNADPAADADLSGTAPTAYTIASEAWSRGDFSRQANSAVFTSVYDRSLYNALRQSIVDIDRLEDADYRCGYTMVSDADYSAVKAMIGRMDGLHCYGHYVPKNLSNYYDYLNYFALSIQVPANYEAAFDYIQPILSEIRIMPSDRDKVIRLNEYLCSLLRYDVNATAGITETFSAHSGELSAACGSYARAFNFLCDAAGIPAFTIGTNDHGWNMVYVDGQWLHVDVSQNDLSLSHNSILLSTTAFQRVDRAPEATAFLKELLVPGSTK